LCEYDQRSRAFRARRRFDAQFEIVSFSGSVSEHGGKLDVQAYVALSRERDNGIELVGGRLVAGRVFSVEFVLDVFDDLILRRTLDAQTGLPLWSEALSLESSPPPFEAPARGILSQDDISPQEPDPPAAWREVVAASAAAPEPETAPVEDRQIAPGDWIDHPKFGRCQVERIEGDYEFVSARLRNQRLIRLSLDILTLIPVGQEDGHHLFRAVPGR
jgi:hypothetical protein